MELKNWRIVHSVIARSPTDEWNAQRLREATPWGKGPKYLIHDRDNKYGTHFSAIAAGSIIKELKTPYRSPSANAHCERFMGSLKRECLDHSLILHDRHLRRVVKEYTVYFNQARPHQGIKQRIPDYYDQPKSNLRGRITFKAFLGGLHRSYTRTII
jgi:putative transposase